MWTAWEDVWKGEALTLSQQKIKKIKFRNIILLKFFDYNTAYMHHKTKIICIYLCMYTMGKLLELVLIPIVYYIYYMLSIKICLNHIYVCI